VASLVQLIHDGRRWFLQSNLEDYVVAWTFAMPRYYYDRLLAAVIRQPLLLGGLELTWCPELSSQTLRVVFGGIEGFLTWEQETAVIALLLPAGIDESTRRSLIHSMHCLLFLLHQAAPFAPSLPFFECADRGASWTTASLSEFLMLPSD
jgi:hypothetical protein